MAEKYTDPIIYSSHNLSHLEKNYTQINKEALPLVSHYESSLAICMAENLYSQLIINHWLHCQGPRMLFHHLQQLDCKGGQPSQQHIHLKLSIHKTMQILTGGSDSLSHLLLKVNDNTIEVNICSTAQVCRSHVHRIQLLELCYRCSLHQWCCQ